MNTLVRDAGCASELPDGHAAPERYAKNSIGHVDLSSGHLTPRLSPLGPRLRPEACDDEAGVPGSGSHQPPPARVGSVARCRGERGTSQQRLLAAGRDLRLARLGVQRVDLLPWRVRGRLRPRVEAGLCQTAEVA